MQVMLDGYEQEHSNQHQDSKRRRQQCDKEAPVAQKMQHVTFQPYGSPQPSLTRPAAGPCETGVMTSTIEDCRQIRSPVVSPTHAVIQPLAVVIKVFHTLVANSTVLHFRAAELKNKKNKKTLLLSIGTCCS